MQCTEPTYSYITVNQ